MDQSTPAAARGEEAIIQGTPSIADPSVHINPMHESNSIGHPLTFSRPPVRGRGQIEPQSAPLRCRDTVYQRSHGRTVHPSHPSSPQRLVNKVGSSSLCSSPESGENDPSPSFSATTPSSPVSYLSPPLLRRERPRGEERRQDIVEGAAEFSDREENVEGSVINDGNGVSEEIWPMLPTVLTRNLRYSFRERHIEKRKTECRFEPLERTFEENNLPEGWTKIIGPEGFPYFWHAEFQVITDTWIPDRQMYERLWSFLKQIQAFTKRQNYRKEPNVHLVVDVHEGDGKWWCGYYLVDHSNFSVFWYERFMCVIRELGEIKSGKISKNQMKVFTEWEYWKHWCLFPNLCPTPTRVWICAENYIRNAQADLLTAKDRAATNLTRDELRDMMTILLEAKASHSLSMSMNKNERESKLPLEQCPWFIGRFMEPLARERHLNFYGEKHARINARQSVYGRPTPNSTSIPFRIASTLFFFVPDSNLKAVKVLLVDHVYSEPWNQFFNDLSEDLARQLFYASLLLTSNIAFLAVPNVTSESEVVQGTLVQIPSYLSTLATFGSLILGLQLSRQIRGSYQRRQYTAEDIHSWVMSNPRHVEALAIRYSLPYALLMWGMITFLGSFMIMCFNHTTAAARMFTAVWCGVIGLFFLWFWLGSPRNSHRTLRGWQGMV